MRHSLSLAVAMAGILCGQTAAPSLSFDVTSVKPSPPGTNGSHMGLAPGEIFNASGVPLGQLIAVSYHVQNFQIVGASGWVESDRWEVVGKPEPSVVESGDPEKFTGAQTAAAM